MNSDNLLFKKVKPIELLKPEQFPLWGKMTPQHMVEHITNAFRMSVRKINTSVLTPEDKLPLMRKILLSSRPLPKNYKNPILPEYPLELEYQNIYFAKQYLHEAMIEFYEFFENSASETPIHPIFGELNFNEWEIFHTKHLQHHFAQFGLK
jgi:oxepin-CoA hydrolase/3-oxo-5,6-dehydrosuberyl-CoA semialdehyde dehydrogenase